MMDRRHALTALSSVGVSVLAGCALVTAECPDDPIVDDSIPVERRSIQFFSDNQRPPGVEPNGPPSVEFDTDQSRVVIRGIFSGATPQSGFPKDMIVVDRLQYTEETDTLEVRLRERQCKSSGAGVGGETTPYRLTVTFPAGLPGQVCAQEGGGMFADQESVYRTCVSR